VYPLPVDRNGEWEDGMGVDDYRDREGDAEERTGVGQGERVGEVDQGAVGTVSDDRDAEGDAEARTGLGSDPEGVDDDFTDTASLGGNPASG
jgi:hypothetical protein